jgi:hypothetical protein
MSKGELLCWTAVVALSAAAGCGGSAPEVQALTSALQVIDCPTRTGCTLSNGPGVYQQKDLPLIDDPQHGFQATITHFVNSGSAVSVHGYFRKGSARWQAFPSSAAVYRADYNGKTNYKVQSVSENGTYPTWTLVDANGATLNVSGVDLVAKKLKLYVNLLLDGQFPLFHYYWYTLDFSAQDVETVDNGKIVTTNWTYFMTWRHIFDQGGVANETYCRAANGETDTVLFQRGFDASPWTGAITRNATTQSYVTLSCGLGALATGSLMGYDYVSDDGGYFFDAFVQMKRAAYCPNGAPHTTVGKELEVDATGGVGIAHDVIWDAHIEAFWTPTGAACVGKLLRDAGFDRTCGGKPIKSCSDELEEHWKSGQDGKWLESGVLP